MTRIWRSDASGARGVWAPPVAGRELNQAAAVESGNYVEYCVTIPTAGSYFVNARFEALSNTADSFFVEVASPQGMLYGPVPWHTGHQDGFRTKRINLASPVNSTELALPAGEITLRFHNREAGVVLDYFVVKPLTVAQPTATATPTPIPAATSTPRPTATPVPTAACSGLTAQAEEGDISSDLLRPRADSAAQNGLFVGTPEGSGNYMFIDPAAADRVPHVDFCLRTDARMDYRFSARVRSANNFADSFWVSIDGREPVVFHTGFNGLDYFETDLRAPGGDDPLTFFLSLGEHSVRVYAREDGARLDSISLVPIDPPQPTCGDLTREAEFGRPLGEPQGAIVRAKDPGAAGGEYVGVPNAGARSSYSTADYVEYCVEVPVTGTYRMNARVMAETTGDDSFWVRIDESTQKLWHIGAGSGWRTLAVTDAARRQVAEWYLPAGEHRVRFYQREDGAKLDSFELVRVGSPDPVRIMALGDSITNSRFFRESLIPLVSAEPCAIDWVGPRTTKSVHNAGLDGDHAGFPGAVAGEIADMSQVLGDAYRPDIVLIHAGTNNLKNPAVPVSSVVNDIKRTVQELRIKNPNVTVLVAQIIPSRTANHAPFADMLAAQAPSWSTASSQVIVVDLYNNFDTNTLLRDSVHPNSAGGDEMARRWRAGLDAVDVCAAAG